jgi:hypothetical protein
LRSIDLERDFDDVVALSDYVVTPFGAETVTRILDGMRPQSGRRAWRITGDFGTGKSSLALVLAHLLATDDIAHQVRPIAKQMGIDLRRRLPLLLPALATGAREGFVPAIAKALRRALQRTQVRGRPPAALASLIARAEQIAASGGPDDLLAFIEQATTFVSDRGFSGLLLIVDEMGKLLEHAALNPDREDVYILQRLAEAAARSGERTFVLIGLLHQGFQSYAEKLPSSMRHEWDKVAGRFEEIVFDQPLAHTIGLIAGALRLDPRQVPREVKHAAQDALASALKSGWCGLSGYADAAVDPFQLYPLHPTVIPVLSRFFARFGQHERSLFSFLLSNEPFGLQAYASRPIGPTSWYRVADFYDYVRAVFGHSLGGASHRSHWTRMVTTIDNAKDLEAVDEQILKSVALLNLIDADDLQADENTLASAVAAATDKRAVRSAIARLTGEGLLFRRGASGAFRLWPAGSVNIESAFQTAARTLEATGEVARHLTEFLEDRAILARRHYLKTGTMRNFEFRYSSVDRLDAAALATKEGDGAILVVLTDTVQEKERALAWAQSESIRTRPEVIVAVSPPLRSLAAELQDARNWQWVMKNTPELAHDQHAASEVARQSTAARLALTKRLSELLDLSNLQSDAVSWLRRGTPMQLPQNGSLTALISSVCDDLYSDAPKITNELLNRSQLSSPASAARMRLIEGMFEASDQPLLGIDAVKAPPEKSMYLSVLAKGRVHRDIDGQHILAEPEPGEDPLNLLPALKLILRLISEAQSGRAAVTDLAAELQARPYGVRAGVVPLLIAIVVTSHLHELALY